MKTTKLFFQFIKFCWNCNRCGTFNPIQVSDGKLSDANLKPEKIGTDWLDQDVVVTCYQCKLKRQVTLTINDGEPTFTPERIKKYEKKRKLWKEKIEQENKDRKREYIKSLKKEARKEKRK